MPDPGTAAANTTWLLVSSALVLLMGPGLAMFYGGLNRSKGVLNMMMMTFSSLGLVSVLWVFYGFTISFGTNSSTGVNKFVGSFTQYLGTKNYLSEIWLVGGKPIGIPTYAVMVFQMMFAAITVALISGSLSDRTKFAGWMAFMAGWATLVYFPVAHMVWGGGLVGVNIGALDFAGGTAVHINAGAAALALTIVLGKRIGFKKDPMKPHNVPFVALGAGLLWFGWFGFNAGSELTIDSTATIAFVNTQVATAAAVLGWIAVEWIRDKKPTMVGASSGAVAGLVAITPACAFIAPFAAVLLGLIAGAVCAMAVGLKYKFGYDDSLDVVGVHFVGGWIGSLWIGLFGSAGINSMVTHEGLFYGGGVTQLGKQFLGSGLVTVYSFVIALILGFAIEKTIGFRVSSDAEVEGIDLAEHAETAYDLVPASGGGGGAFAAAGLASSGGSVAATKSATVSETVAG